MGKNFWQLKNFSRKKIQNYLLKRLIPNVYLPKRLFSIKHLGLKTVFSVFLHAWLFIKVVIGFTNS